jgi:hypothetical protein
MLHPFRFKFEGVAIVLLEIGIIALYFADNSFFSYFEIEISCLCAVAVLEELLEAEYGLKLILRSFLFC